MIRNVVGVVVTTAAVTFAQTPDVELLPWPASVQVSQSPLPLDRGLQVRSNRAFTPRLQAALERFRTRLALRTGIHHNESDAPALEISFSNPAGRYPVLGDDESYKLNVTATGARLDAPTDTGILRGLETVLQLANPGPNGMAIRGVVIDDRPRFPWRGLMLDVARHWIPLPDVKRTLDGMAAAKLNVLHWHLSDDQGFRVETKRYPKLQTIGGEGKYYTQSQIRELVNYAAARGIRVIPEFDIPGHTTAWVAAYPELASLPGTYTVERKWGIFDPALDPTRDETYTFLDNLFGEIMPLFPDQYFHIGGDELNGKQWSASEKIIAFRKAHNLADNVALHGYFNKRLLAIVQKHGKTMMGWDEVLSPDLPKDVVIQSWRGPMSLLEAARQGHSGLLSFGYYLDLMYPAGAHYLIDPLELDAPAYQSIAEFFGLESGRGALPVKAVAKFAVEMKDIPEDVARRVLGGEACMWVELVTPDNLDDRLWPRTAAMAERFWSPASVKDVWSMYRRLDAFGLHLATVGISPEETQRFMRRRLAGGRELQSVETLATAVEPVKAYFRSGTGKYTSLVPMNRMVDSVPAESRRARDFGRRVNEYLQSHSQADRDAILGNLQQWSDVEKRFGAERGDSALLAELVPVATEVSAVAGIGIEAMKRLDARQTDAAWPKSQLERLNAAATPKAELLLSILPHVRRLVSATAR